MFKILTAWPFTKDVSYSNQSDEPENRGRLPRSREPWSDLHFGKKWHQYSEWDKIGIREEHAMENALIVLVRDEGPN